MHVEGEIIDPQPFGDHFQRISRGAERRALYVTTTGGIVTPPGGVVQAAKLIRLEVGADGYPLSGLA